MLYGFLADVMVAIHVAYVGFVVIGQLLILVGWGLGWRWVRNPWFRRAHLVAIGLVAGVEIINIRCPRTVWEEQFRELAGQPFSGETFLSRLMHWLIFVEGKPPRFFTALHLGFTGLIVATLFLVPPRMPGR